MKDLIAKVEAVYFTLLIVANEFSFSVMGAIGNHTSCFYLKHYKVLKAALKILVPKLNYRRHISV